MSNMGHGGGRYDPSRRLDEAFMDKMTNFFTEEGWVHFLDMLHPHNQMIICRAFVMTSPTNRTYSQRRSNRLDITRMWARMAKIPEAMSASEKLSDYLTIEGIRIANLLEPHLFEQLVYAFAGLDMEE